MFVVGFWVVGCCGGVDDVGVCFGSLRVLFLIFYRCCVKKCMICVCDL